MEVRFVVEGAGCAACSARIESALAPLLAIDHIEIDEQADRAAVAARVIGSTTAEAVDAALAAASAGSGHEYRIRPGSWSAFSFA